MGSVLPREALRAMDAYWRAANYLSVGQIYLLDNPLLRRPLGPEDVKRRLLGHWGTTPGLNFIYVHLSVADHCLRSRNYVNVIVAGKQPSLQYLDMDAAIKHCTAGIGIWEWASNDRGSEPDVVMACAGDVPTLETHAAVALLRQHLPELKVRVVNVVNQMKLQPPSEHPHGLPDREFDALYTTDRFHLVTDVIDRVPGLAARAAYVTQAMRDKRVEHRSTSSVTARTCRRSGSGHGATF
jgi:phosphoketolase